MRPVDGRSPALEHDDFGRRVAAKDPYLILFRLAGVNRTAVAPSIRRAAAG